MAAVIAQVEDESAIKRLIESAELPTSDIAPAVLRDFHLLRDAGSVTGVIGLEIDGAVALLRSLAVDPSRRGRGAGAELLRAVEDHAPEPIRRSTQFQSLCPASSILIVKRLRAAPLISTFRNAWG